MYPIANRSTAENGMNAEESRLKESQDHTAPWRSWGPYVSERAWGTVREDYSATGEAWDYFPHDHARSRAYRWSEDGLAGICDRVCRCCAGCSEPGTNIPSGRVSSC